MAKRFLTTINVLNSSSDPASASDGDIYYNTSTSKLRIYSNSAWTDVSSGGSGGVTSLTGTTDEIDVSSSTGAITLSLPTTINANTTGSAATLSTTRSIGLSGDVTGSGNFNGSANLSITSTLANSGVSANSYGSASTVPTFTVDSKGRLTSASNTNIEIAQSSVTNLVSDLSTKANLASPTLTGTPLSTTATTDTNTTQIATTAFVVGQAGSSTPIVNGVAASGTSLRYSRQDHVHGTDTTRAPLNSPTFTGNVTVPTPVNSTDASTKAYVDGVAEGLHIHASVSTATTSNISLTTPPATIDGVTLTNNMRILVKNQSTQSQNGIYVFSTSTGQLSRASDFDSPAEIDGGDFVFVSGGTVNNDTGWVQTEIVITIGTDPIIFTQFSGAGTYSAGTGLLLTGTVFSNTGVLSVNGSTGAVTGVAPTISPALSGTPTAPTATANTNTTQIATTAFVLGQGNSTAVTIAMNGTQAAGSSNLYARADHIHPIDTSRAPLASPALTGTPTSPTAAVDNNTTQIATTAYVIGQNYAKLASPSLTGTPLSTTAAVDTNTAQIATTAFVIGQGYAKLASPTFTGTVTAPLISLTTADTATASSHYIVETASDGILRPKTLANVQSEIVSNTIMQSNIVSPTAVGSNGIRKTTMSTSAPTGGNDGDVWLVHT